MDPLNDLYRRTEKLRREIRAESDPVLRKAMTKTHNSLMKEIRRASSQKSPERLFIAVTAGLVILVACAVYGVVHLEAFYGIRATIVSVVLVIIVFIALSAMTFLAMKVITPRMYAELVRSAMATLRTVMSNQQE